MGVIGVMDSSQQHCLNENMSINRSQHDQEPLAYDARAIANAILEAAQTFGQPVYVTSLLKILYFAHGWHLARFGEPLVGQPFEAWQHGPVVRVVFDQVKQFSGRPIEGRLTSFDASQGAYLEARVELPTRSKELLDSVVRAYGPLHPFALSDLTHEPGSPWEKAWLAAEEGRVPGARIENGEIRQYFLRLNRSDMV